MSKIHFITTAMYTAKVCACGENVISFEILSEKSHAESGAILPQELTESSLSETGSCFLIQTKELTAKIAKSGDCFALYNKNDVLIAQTHPQYGYHANEKGGFTLHLQLQEEEHIYGLGQDNDIALGRLDRRGTVRDMITGQRINQNHVTADYPIPFILSAGGNVPYGFYLDNTSNLTVDIGKTAADKLSIHAPAGFCKFYFIAEKTISEIVCKFSAMTGHAKLPPLWVLGYMQSKCSFWNWEEIEDVILTFAEKGIPLDSIVFDFDWAQYFNNYKWADRWEGKSAEKMQHYREKYGIHFMASNSGPMLKKDSDTFESALAAGILARDADGNTVTCGHYSGELMDFTNPAVKEWLEPQLRRIMDDGIESWWLDLTEPEGDADNTVYHAGSRAEVHNIFSNAVSETYHRVMQKHAPGKRSFVLTRTGTAGIQRNPTALWSGDIYSEYGTLSAHIPEALNTQLSGISMWTCDTGGFLSPTNNNDCPYNLYHNDRTEHGELFERWMQFSCFTPIYRAHHAGGESVPSRYQDITLDGMTHYIRLRYRLIPYIYSLYYENYLQGTPIMRPLFWHYPEDKKAYEIRDEYLFGENILVAPVICSQTTHRSVYFPEGKWYDFDYDYVYEGGQEYEVYAPQNRIPVFVKAGGIIPMAKDVTNTKDLDLSCIEALIYPKNASEACVYTDDGNSDKYLEGMYTETKISCKEDTNRLEIRIEGNNSLFPVKEITAHIHMKKAPAKILFNASQPTKAGRLTTVRHAEKNTYCFDEFNRMLHVKVFLSENMADLADDGNILEIELDENRCYRTFEPFAEDKLAGQLPYIYPPAAIPCLIPAAHYDRGGEGEAFHKNVTNTTGVYRDDNAGIVQTENNFYISALEKGEWLEYTISSAKEGIYDIILEGNTANAKIAVSIENAQGEIANGKASLRVGTGQKILRMEVREGSTDLNTIRIERQDN